MLQYTTVSDVTFLLDFRGYKHTLSLKHYIACLGVETVDVTTDFYNVKSLMLCGTSAS